MKLSKSEGARLRQKMIDKVAETKKKWMPLAKALQKIQDKRNQ